jgi:pimeloyl-ACP methyl ester carboxylesterase
MYFHGTPSCRLEPAFADAACSDLGVHLVSFDRPGYGESTPQPFGLVSIANATAAIADHLGFGRFATLGQSGGGPFSLAAAAVLGDRVTRAGVAAGAVPFQLVPGAGALLDENDTAAVALLPDRDAAAARFARGFEPFRGLLAGSAAQVEAGLRARSIAHDQDVLDRTGAGLAVAVALQASMVHGTTGAGWDNVAWVGPWDIDLDAVRRPVHLWYGGADVRLPPRAGPWLAEHLPDATLHLREDDGHLGVIEHLDEVLETLLAE